MPRRSTWAPRTSVPVASTTAMRAPRTATAPAAHAARWPCSRARRVGARGTSSFVEDAVVCGGSLRVAASAERDDRQHGLLRDRLDTPVAAHVSGEDAPDQLRHRHSGLASLLPEQAMGLGGKIHLGANDRSHGCDIAMVPSWYQLSPPWWPSRG